MTHRRAVCPCPDSAREALEENQVRWQNEQMQSRVKAFEGWTAQIIQHEIDHCDGILI